MSDDRWADRPRILIVEDEEASREMLQRLLEMEGYAPLTACDTESALALVDSTRPDVALIDIGLPGPDGLETARRIRRNPSNVAMILIALTGRGSLADVEASRQAGFDAHLVKPLKFDELCHILDTIGLQA